MPIDLGDDRVGEELLASSDRYRAARMYSGLRIQKPKPTTTGSAQRSPAEKRCCAVAAFILAARLRRSRTSSARFSQHLHQIRAGLPLQNQSGDEELQIDERNAAAQAVQRVFKRRAESEFLDHLAEFHSYRVEGLLRDGFETGVHVVAGLHRAVEQIDGVGQHRFEFVQSAARARGRI